MIPDVQRSAIARITLPISHFPFLACPSSEPAAAIITPHTRIHQKHTKRIIVVSILVSPHISLGKAVTSVTTVVSSVLASVQSLIQFPINGTFVFSFTPQQTPGALQLSHLLLFH